MNNMRVYTVSEISKLFQITPVSVRNYLKEGRIKGQKVGSKWLVSEEALKEFLNAPGTSKNVDA